MAEKLEPCPFCGSSDIRIFETGGGSRAYAFCDGCDAEGPLGWGDTDEAIRLWNTRKQKEPTK
jgi:Lar family restriction alleviation protein